MNVRLLQKQYTLVQSSREFVLNFIETAVGADLNTPRRQLMMAALFVIYWCAWPIRIFIAGILHNENRCRFFG
jgi:hypothetical protein